MFKKKDTIFQITKSNDNDQTIEGIFSTSDIDRSGDPPIDQETWDLKNFKKNPVVLFAHNNMFSSDPNIVVGKVVKIGLDEKGNLAGKIKFAVDEGVGIYGDFIKTIYNLYKEKFMNAFSVGFMMGEIVIDKKKNTRMVNNQLLEISCVPVPANAYALAKQKGLDMSVIEKVLKPDHKNLKGDVKEVKEKEFILFVDKKEKSIKVLDGEKEIGKGIILKQFRDKLFKIKEQKKVVTECSDKRKVKPSNKGTKNINKIIRTLLSEKRKVKSNTETK